MILKLLRDDTRGAVIVEFSVTIGVFLLLTFGLIQAGLLLWTNSALQHGVEYAARCASVNYSANQMGLNTSCFGVAPGTVTNNIIEQYAIDHSYGLVPAINNFQVIFTPPPGGALGCPTNVGYQVIATYQYNVLEYIFPAVTLNATSKFPVSCS